MDGENLMVFQGLGFRNNKKEQELVVLFLEKENDFTYKGVVNYTDGKQISSMYKYDKTYNSIEEDPSDVKKKEKEYNIYGRIVLNLMINIQ